MVTLSSAIESRADLEVSPATESPLVRLHREQERRWRQFLDRHYPDARLLRWGPQHRVFRVGLRVAKVEWMVAEWQASARGLKYEFSLLEALEGSASRLNPSYRVIDGEWCILEMDWVEGDYLSDLIGQGRAREVSIVRLVGKLFRVSLAGVIYKQFRARHVIRRTNGELAFIDFGHSSHAHPLAALRRNFTPLRFPEGGREWGRLVAIIREILRRRGREGAQDATLKRHASASAVRQWRVNERRTSRALPLSLTDHPGDPVAARHFAAMERCLVEAVAEEPGVCVDLIKFQFADYGMAGSRDWGFIWDHIAGRVEFAGKRIVDLGCGMGGVGAFARIEGAAHVSAFDSVPLLLDAARNFAEALGFTDNSYGMVDLAGLVGGTEALPDGDVVTALSARLEDVPQAQLLDLLAGYPEVLWQTANVVEGRRALEARGYRTVETLARADADRYILYATDRVP